MLKLPVITAALLAAERALQTARYLPPDTQTARQNELTSIRSALDAPVVVALAEVNGRAEKHALTTGREIRIYAEEAEKALDRAGIPQAERVGTTVTATPAGPGANAYNTPPRAPASPCAGTVRASGG